jgi:molecular chaperone GrpE
MSKQPSHNEKHHEVPLRPDEAPDQTGTVDAAADSGAGTAPKQEAGGAAGTAGAPAVPGAAAQAAEGGTNPGQDGGEGENLSPEQRIVALEAELADSTVQLADVKDQLLRKAADFENFRKRMNREKQDAIDFANQSLLLDLIPILDDFDRAMQAAGGIVGGTAGGSASGPAEGSKDFNSLYEGVGMIAKRLASTLDSKWGLASYVSTGAVFDPNRHEALMMEKSSAVDEQIVQMDMLKGYTLKDRVIRSAKVKVLVPDPAAPAIAPPSAVAEGAAADAAEGNGA